MACTPESAKSRLSPVLHSIVDARRNNRSPEQSCVPGPESRTRPRPPATTQEPSHLPNAATRKLPFLRCRVPDGQPSRDSHLCRISPGLLSHLTSKVAAIASSSKRKRLAERPATGRMRGSNNKAISHTSLRGDIVFVEREQMIILRSQVEADKNGIEAELRTDSRQHEQGR